MARRGTTLARLQRIARPLAFARVRGRGLGFYLWRLPAVLSTALSLAIYLAGMKPTAPGGIVSDFQGLLQMLAGFYVAGLAAVVAVQGNSHQGLDLPGHNAPTLNGKELTRREFVALMFGYLAVGALGTYCLTVVALKAGPALASAVGHTWVYWRWLPIVAWASLVSHLASITLLGMSYLSRDMFTASAGE